MAKSETAAISPPSKRKLDKWEIEDALRTLTRAQEIIADKKLMAEVKKMAGQKAEEMEVVAEGVDALMKRGLISAKAAEKMMDKKEKKEKES